MTTNMSVITYIRSDMVVKRINELLGKRSGQFVTSLVTAVNQNQKLATCDPQSVLNAALTAASLDLPINDNLGFAYLIPYKNKDGEVCQFQMGYKGFIQLAQRSGHYKTIEARPVKSDEFLGLNEMTGEPLFKFSIDSTGEVVGYMAYFRLVSGFEKSFYMTKDEAMAHANKYSKNFAKWKSGLWKDDFDAMAIKTVIKLLISKFGPMNTQIQEAVLIDQTVDGEYEDNPLRKPELSGGEKEAIKDEALALADDLESEVTP